MMIWIAAALLASSQAPPALPPAAELRATIAARDSEFFALVFDRCEPQRLREMITPDFEMYHDRGGVIARNADAMVADYARSCAARAAPDAWRSRRELVAPSLTVDPVPGYGAIESGEHLFYERQGDGPERLAGRARFTQLWVIGPDGWRLARVFSYGHRAAQ